ncbi:MULTISPECIES: DUF58 domain-containing protein [Cryobacterium]|uniref:DUF58 domain-containing protein n=1 Tax=Cryobacterium glucosi TaxID=1259175 RepID=A0ABY2IN83_9MICO|nr:MULTISPECIES: DUF58 domain-containing protein [Cryobacterium]MEB0001817.1 DUF58 domain-containing protein [Cryobacterium sp. RTC2.1]TFB99175.1 DUF58 domain-containing protein [Cryobacterium sp. MDB2-A-1]TFC06629.1 DUF58 domain-containing protein [Cryobacterium sp. MDB2-33-2]TFC13882.1 DUF58 domain-containing protein [Cryobacterium sp. MDB2-10]TFC15793.1 DUF58 domain-containing protein [Cryobacterium sp. MDB2-A-2]
MSDLGGARPNGLGEDTADGRLAVLLVHSVRAVLATGALLTTTWRLATAVVTVLGWSVLASAAVALATGYLLGWTELVVLGWAGLALVLASFGFLFGRTAYQIRLRVPVDRVVVGERVPGELIVRNPTGRRLPGVGVEVPVGLGLAEFAMPGLARGASFEDVFIVPTVRRGIIPIGPVRTVRADPVGLVRRELVWAERVDLFVHPRTLPIPSMSTGFIRDLEGNPTRDLTNLDMSFHALREYVPGDERRSIHWKSTAKTGRLMVRQYEESRRSHLLVALSLAADDYADDEEFELAVSVAGSLGVRAIRDARTVSVVTSTVAPAAARTGAAGRDQVQHRPNRAGTKRRPAAERLSTLTITRLLDDLCRVDRTADALPLGALAQSAADAVAGVSVAFLVYGSTVSLAELRAAATHFPGGVEVVAVVCATESVPSLRRVAELSVLTIGFLEDLQQSLAKGVAA